MHWTIKPPHTEEELGFIPDFLMESDPRPAKEQFNERYSHGGGWNPFKGFKMLPDGRLKYPEDPPLEMIAWTTLRDETIRFYEHSWVVILQSNGDWEASRID